VQKPERLPSNHSEIDESFSDVFEAQLTDWSYAITFGLRSVRSDESTSITIRYACHWPRPRHLLC